MNRLLSSLFRKVLANTVRRQVHHSAKLFQSKDKKDDKGVSVPNPFCLQVIEPGGSTIRDHDNFRRQRLYEFGLYTAACLPKWVQKIQLQHTDELEVLCAPEGIFQVLSFLRNHQHACFNQLSYLTAIDVPSRPYRFEVVYCLNSYRYCERIRLKTYTDELTPLESCCSLWYCGNWFERETYDMYGIVFTNHPDLRRMLTDYGFTGHPLRKDFPQIGYHECRYDDELKKIVYEPIEFSQEQRRYQIECPWVYYRNFHEGYNQPKKEVKK